MWQARGSHCREIYTAYAGHGGGFSRYNCIYFFKIFFYNIEGIVIRNSPTSFFFSLSYFGFFCRLILLNCLAFYFSTLDLYLTWVRLTLYIQDACIGGELFCMRCIAGEEKKRQACWDTFFKKIPAPSWGWLNPTCFFRRDPDAND